MWQQEESKPVPKKKDEVVMWSNRGSTKVVSRSKLDDLISQGWVLAAPGTEPGHYNPIYDKGDIKITQTVLPQHVEERNITQDYLEVIEV